MIKITYLTETEGAKKPEKTTIRIFDGKYFATYDVPGKAQATVNKMIKDGRRGVLYSRGQMIQIFNGKSDDEILEIVKLDIENGKKVAEAETKKKVNITNLVIDKQ